MKAASVSSRRAFTLIELITVLAIFAILGALLFPGVSGVFQKAQRATAQNNLQQVAKAYAAYVSGEGTLRTISATDEKDWARVLVQDNPDLNRAELFYMAEDPAVLSATGESPVIVATPPADDAGTTAWTVDTRFSAWPMSIAVVSGLNPAAPPSTTPVAWTRGLQADGSWAADSPFEGEGGYVAFLDGSVRYYRSLAENGGLLRDYQTQQQTADINAAISPGATVLETTPSL